MKKTKIETFLPIFPGFYNTIFEFDDDNILYSINQDRQDSGLSEVNWDSLDIDYKQYESDSILELCNIIASELKDYVYNIELQKINNPKEYNYYNDSADVIIEPKPEAIQAFIYANKEKFTEYLKQRYTSYDGFISHYDNNLESWEADTNRFLDYSIDGHRLGAILEFIALVLNIDQENIYYQLQDVISEYNYINNIDG